MKNLFLLAICAILLSACESGPSYEPLFTGDSQQATDNALIIKALKDAKIEAQHTASGLYYVIDSAGTGPAPKTTDVVTCHYSGFLLDGKKFDSSFDRGEPTQFPLNQVIKGWTEGIPLLAKGGKGSFWIPSDLGYGARDIGKGLIPPNSVLKFDVELIDFASQQEMQAKQLAIDKKGIETYCQANNLTEMQYTESGIAYKIEKVGKGDNPTSGSTVLCNYRGTLLDGTEFDSSYERGEPIEFPLSGVIVGWQEAIPLLKPGGKGTFVIPSTLAYGAQGRPGIPANSTLVFDVELVEVK